MRTPLLYRILPSEGPDHAVVYVRGWMSKRSRNADDQRDWADALRALGFRGAVYHLWWDAKGAKAPRRMARRATRSLFLPIALAAANAAIAGDSIVGHFLESRTRAKKTGARHADALIASVPERAVTVVGFSLGARVLFSFLGSMKKCQGRIEDVLLIGGAIRRGKKHDWAGAASRVGGRIINAYSDDDPVLGVAYTNLHWGQSPCGLAPIKAARVTDKIVNVDVTKKVQEHDGLDYLEALEPHTALFRRPE